MAYLVNNFARESLDHKQRNSWKTESNCLGYALGIKRWMRVNLFEELTNDAIAEVFENTFGLKRVQKKDMKLGKEYFAMRFAGKSDYHFMWRGKKGHWRHKFSWDPVETISQKYVFSKEWVAGWNHYRGTIYLYEFNRGDMKFYFDKIEDIDDYKDYLYDYGYDYCYY